MAGTPIGNNPTTTTTPLSAAYANDGSTTKWGSSGVPPNRWIGYRFPQQVDIHEIAMTNATLGDSCKSFDVQYWDQATSTWVTSWSVGPVTWASAPLTKVFTKP
jgi:hypothetical protein